MKKLHLHALALLFSCLSAVPSWAASADRAEPVDIVADRMTIDDRNKTHTFEGNVVLTQGSLQIKGDKMVVIQGADGYQTGIATGSANRPATFRQRREGTQEFVEGEAVRIEYDSRNERARLFTRARVKSGTDLVTGDFIEYDALTERYYATNAPGTSTGSNRVRAVIQPRGSDTP